jgi:hypothetical protein
MHTVHVPHHWIEYVSDWRDEAMAYWVHFEESHLAWRDAAVFDPPAPRMVLHQGYPVLCVESQGMVFRFSSVAQLVECKRVLSLTPLPTSSRLFAIRSGGNGSGPNSHWLSRLPGRIKTPRRRRHVVEDLDEVLRSRSPENSFWSI